MKYKLEDIVEIVTAKYTKASDIPQHEFNSYNCLINFPPIVGQRFIVKGIQEGFSGEIMLYSQMTGLSAKESCVMLYYRPEQSTI